MFGFFSKVRSNIEATKNKLTSTIKSIFGGKILDSHSIEELEEILYSADIGVDAAEMIISEVKNIYKSDKLLRGEDTKVICRNILSEILIGADKGDIKYADSKIPEVICLIGTNGSGKTTITAKLANFFSNQKKSVIVGACDTFRAAANEQIKIWSNKLNFDLVESHSGADPSAVAFDTCHAALSRNKNIAILDTAGRLHNKSNLIAELAKLKRAVGKINPAFPQHIWLVVDASLGANSITSAKKFHEEFGLTGIVITKLDGTSRGGTIIGIYKELKIPIYFMGTGESKDDIIPFNTENYLDALFGI